MKFKVKNLLPWLVAAAISVFSCTALATPKAAENEDEPVTLGADVAKPILSAKSAKPAKQKVAKKARPASKGKARKIASRKK